MRFGSKSAALSLIEILVTVAIIAVLVAVLIVISPVLRDKAEGAKCANNLRQLHVVFSSYVQDKGHWPQEPPEFAELSNDNQFEDWIIEELKSYGGEQSLWKCPTVWRRVTSRKEGNRPHIHYTPTMFDELPGTPYKWSTQPWFVEIGDMHGHGPLICYPDGSIHSLNEALATKR